MKENNAVNKVKLSDEYNLFQELLEEEIPEMVVCPYCKGVTYHAYETTSFCVNCYQPINDGDLIHGIYEND